MTARVDELQLTDVGGGTKYQHSDLRAAPHYVRYFNRNETVIRTSHSDMCALTTGHNGGDIWHTPGRIPGNFYTKMRARTEKKVRFALDNERENEDVLTKCDCKDQGKRCFCSMKTRDKEQVRQIKSRHHGSHSDNKDNSTDYLNDRLNSINGYKRQSSFCVATAPNNTSRALTEAIVRKTGSENTDNLYSPRALPALPHSAYSTKSSSPRTRAPLQTVVSPELALGARSFTTLLDDVLREKSRTPKNDVPRYSRYRPVGAYESARQREVMTLSPDNHVSPPQSPRQARYTSAVSFGQYRRGSSSPVSTRMHQRQYPQSPRLGRLNAAKSSVVS